MLDVFENLREGLARKAVDSKLSSIIDTIRTGWNDYSFIFYIGGISAILGGLFGIAGWLSIVVTVAFFYYVGDIATRIKRERERRERARRLRAIKKK
jgi:uncharacterized membrane protein